MVIYSGSPRAPSVWLNEKVSARLGRDLARTGRIPEEAIGQAMQALRRFALILRDLDIASVRTVATAAARDAVNGARFIALVEALGLSVEVLSGIEEAQTAAYGALGAFPGAVGAIADMGGGSLELAAIGDGGCSHPVSLPLGTLRLPALRQQGHTAFEQAIEGHLAGAGWHERRVPTLYLVGGTWRALAAYAMDRRNYPLSDSHGFAIAREEALRLCAELSGADPATLADIAGINSSRAAGLPDAAAMLVPVLRSLSPERLVISAWGLREGVLFRDLPDQVRAADPLLAAAEHFTGSRGVSYNHAVRVAGWTSEAIRGLTPGSGNERVRLAFTMLALAQQRLEPNMRLSHARDWALDKRWIGLSHRGKAMMAAALSAASGKPAIDEAHLDLATRDDLYAASAWGLAFRLCRRVGAGSRISIMTSRLSREGDTLTLWLGEERADLLSHHVQSDCDRLADWLGCTAAIRVGGAADGSAQDQETRTAGGA